MFLSSSRHLLSAGGQDKRKEKRAVGRETRCTLDNNH